MEIKMNRFSETSMIAMAFLLLFAIPATVAAQGGKYGKNGEDSITCLENLSIYKDPLKENNYDKAKSFWIKAFTICPKSSLKMYVDGETIFKNLIEKNEKNPARAVELIDSLYLIYDTRIQHFGNEGYVLGKKGAAMLKYNRPGYEAAYNTLKKSVDIDGNNAQAPALIYYFQAAVKINESKPVEGDFWVELFNKCVTICDYNIANSKDSREIEGYTTALDGIVKLADPFLNCDMLIQHYNIKFEEQKDNMTWLENAANMLSGKDCTDDPLFFKLSNRMHTMQPSAASAKNLGIMSMKKTIYADAVKFFTQAVDLAGNEAVVEKKNASLAELELWLARAYFGQNNYEASRGHALKAASYKEKWGDPYMLVGDLYAGSISLCTEDPDGALKTPYWVAVDMYLKAKGADPSVASDASQKIAKYSQYFPLKSEAFFYNIIEGDDYTVGCWINTTTKVRFR